MHIGIFGVPEFLDTVEIVLNELLSGELPVHHRVVDLCDGRFFDHEVGLTRAERYRDQ